MVWKQFFFAYSKKLKTIPNKWMAKKGTNTVILRRIKDKKNEKIN